MNDFPVPSNEAERIEALHGYRVLDTLPERTFDEIAQLSAMICGVSRAMVSFLDESRKWHKARAGTLPVEVARGFAICSRTILGTEPYVVPDTLENDDVRNIGMVQNPPYVRFYAGVPLIDDDGLCLGTLCVIDTEPHEIDPEQIAGLRLLASQVMAQLRLRRDTVRAEARLRRQRQRAQVAVAVGRELEDLVQTDPVTEVHNRRGFDVEIQDSLHDDAAAPVSLLLVDIDDFKAVNDELGHSVGDHVLWQVAQHLQFDPRIDFVARVGGDELAAVLRRTTLTAAAAVAEDVRARIEQGSADQTPVTVSIGVAQSVDGLSASELFAAADTALLAAKRSGRNQVATEPPR